MSAYERMIDEEWDRAEAEYLEQINPLTGEPTVRLPGLFAEKPSKQAAEDGEDAKATTGSVT